MIAAVKAGRFPLVITERTEHLTRIAQTLSASIPNVITLQGGMSRNQIKDALGKLAGLSRDCVLVATGKFIGEGFDEARLDTLFLTLPISWKGTIAQIVGRLHRQHEAKRVVQVYDYADLDVPMLSRMFDRRCEGYESAGYTIQLPGSAVPGWPLEVPLPVDPQWKRDYAASVRRLIRDGVDVPLANCLYTRFPLISKKLGESSALVAPARLFFSSPRNIAANDWPLPIKCGITYSL